MRNITGLSFFLPAITPKAAAKVRRKLENGTLWGGGRRFFKVF